MVFNFKYNVLIMFEYVLYVIIKFLCLCCNDYFILLLLLEMVFFCGFFSLYLRGNKDEVI